MNISKIVSALLILCLFAEGVFLPTSAMALSAHQSIGKSGIKNDVAKITSDHGGAIQMLYSRVSSDTTAKRVLEEAYDPSTKGEDKVSELKKSEEDNIAEGGSREPFVGSRKRNVIRLTLEGAWMFLETLFLMLFKPFSQRAHHQFKWLRLYLMPVDVQQSAWVFERKDYSYTTCARVVLERYIKAYASASMLKTCMKDSRSRVSADVITIFCELAENNDIPGLENIITREVVAEAIQLRLRRFVSLFGKCARRNPHYAQGVLDSALLVNSIQTRSSYILDLCKELVRNGSLMSDDLFVPAVFEALLQFPEYTMKAMSLYLEYPFKVNGQIEWQRLFHRAMKNFAKSHGGRPRLMEQYETFSNFIIGPVSHFLKDCVDVGDSERMAEQLHAISSFMIYAHYQVEVILSGCENVQLPISIFLPLKDAIQNKAALVHIFSLLGGRRVGHGAGGSLLQTFKSVVALGEPWYLIDIMADIGKRWRLKAPQEIDGLLSLLSTMDSREVAFWKEDDWSRLSKEIDDYYDQGFLSLSPGLFAYYRENKNDRERIGEFQKALDVEMREPVMRGEFVGLSGSFLQKYNLTVADELALLTEYVPVTFYSTQYYASTYAEVKEAVKEKSGRGDRIDIHFRESARFTGMQDQMVTNGAMTVSERYYVFDHLRKYLKAPRVSLDDVLRQYVQDPYSVKEHALRSAIVFEAYQRSRGKYAALQTGPTKGAGGQFRYMLLWRSFFTSSMFSEVRDYANEQIRQAVNDLSTEKLEREYFPRLTQRFTESMALEMKRNVVAANLFALTVPFMKELVSADLEIIEKTLQSYEKKLVATHNLFSVGFYDNAAYSMTPMFMPVRVFSELRRQLRDKRYRFGSIVLRDNAGELIGAAHVQFAKSLIAGAQKQRSQKGWGVLSLSTFTIQKYRKDCNDAVALKALFAYAQVKSEQAGLQGAIIPQRRRFHGRNNVEGRLVREFIDKGWLVPCTLTEPIAYTTNKYFCPGPLIFTDAYKINLPQEVLDNYRAVRDRVEIEKESWLAAA